MHFKKVFLSAILALFFISSTAFAFVVDEASTVGSRSNALQGQAKTIAVNFPNNSATVTFTVVGASDPNHAWVGCHGKFYDRDHNNDIVSLKEFDLGLLKGVGSSANVRIDNIPITYGNGRIYYLIWQCNPYTPMIDEARVRIEIN